MSKKFSRVDSDFLTQRNLFLEKNVLPNKMIIDQIGLFLGKVGIGNILAKFDMLKTTAHVPGHILEFGVFHGSNLLLMAKMLELMAPYDLKEFFGFDSFEGLKEFHVKDEHAISYEGSYKGNLQLLEDCIQWHKLSDSINLIKGRIEDTFDVFLNENPQFIFSLMYIDTDLYQSTKIILEKGWPRLSVGGIIAFDEGYCRSFPGEGHAINEFLLKITGKYRMESSPLARQPMYWIRKESN